MNSETEGFYFESNLEILSRQVRPFLAECFWYQRSYILLPASSMQTTYKYYSYVAQFPAGTSIWSKTIQLDFLLSGLIAIADRSILQRI